MKKICLALCLLVPAQFSLGNSLQPGDTLTGNFRLPKLNGKGYIAFSQLRGKVVIIECWATWCSPCIAALQQFEKLRRRFGNKLVVLAVSEEPADRIHQFLNNSRMDIELISDTAGMIRDLFPYRTIPHTIVIDRDGVVRAVTEASLVTENIIQKVFHHEWVHLPLKADRMDFDVADHFRTDTALSFAFNLQPAVSGIGTFTKAYPNSSFANRRITVVNGTRSFLFRLAYGMSAVRTINSYEDAGRYKELEKFCLDAWVSRDSSCYLNEFLKENLARLFIDAVARIEKRKLKVWVLKADTAARTKLEKAGKPPGDYSAGGDHFKGSSIAMAQIAEYLENFGIFQQPVIDQTGIGGYFNVHFQWHPERRSSLHEALRQKGLYLEQREALIDVLVIERRIK